MLLGSVWVCASSVVAFPFHSVGADNFMIPSLIAMLVMFIVLRPYLDDLKHDDADGEVGFAADRNEVGEARS